MKLRTLKDLQLTGLKVLLRSEFNVPMKNGVIADDSRIVKALPTIQYLLEQGVKLIICAHLGRPKGQVNEEFRLTAVAKRLSELLGKPVKKTETVVGNDVKEAVNTMKNGEIVLLENVRFDPREEKNVVEFSFDLANLADIYVSDAFGAVHRAHSSTEGVAHFLPSYAGLLVEKEVKALSGVFESPRHPVVMIVAGSKMETKVAVIERFLDVADQIIIGGGIANTFFAAQGKNIGSSLFEAGEIERAKKILSQDKQGKIYLPSDVTVATELAENAVVRNAFVDDVKDTEKILDIGEKAMEEVRAFIMKAGTVVWNGPVGVYEVKPFDRGTRVITEAMARSNADTILGGGDTADAVQAFGFKEDQFTHVSTGGGASLEFLEGKELPGLKVLELLEDGEEPQCGGCGTCCCG